MQRRIVFTRNSTCISAVSADESSTSPGPREDKHTQRYQDDDSQDDHGADHHRGMPVGGQVPRLNGQPPFKVTVHHTANPRWFMPRRRTPVASRVCRRSHVIGLAKAARNGLTDSFQQPDH